MTQLSYFKPRSCYANAGVCWHLVRRVLSKDEEEYSRASVTPQFYVQSWNGELVAPLWAAVNSAVHSKLVPLGDTPDQIEHRWITIGRSCLFNVASDRLWRDAEWAERNWAGDKPKHWEKLHELAELLRVRLQGVSSIPTWPRMSILLWTTHYEHKPHILSNLKCADVPTAAAGNFAMLKLTLLQAGHGFTFRLCIKMCSHSAVQPTGLQRQLALFREQARNISAPPSHMGSCDALVVRSPSLHPDVLLGIANTAMGIPLVLRPAVQREPSGAWREEMELVDQEMYRLTMFAG
ncbi:hypothetical protein SCP_0300810 [Sparassis crispa]|uniref:Uncharacterized protein n=1 Tax=Sparassis crispa TaxID=139825 RepID=A0A401GDW1_9APHY|nr:hypothetical protein SCP_0300810 [Sparassis crispa]GBE80366.1 hypothetical protein SCP_0300810 [Sparassis crispa]